MLIDWVKRYINSTLNLTVSWSWKTRFVNLLFLCLENNDIQGGAYGLLIPKDLQDNRSRDVSPSHGHVLNTNYRSPV